MKTSETFLTEKLIYEFTHNVMSRNESNQRKATILFSKLKDRLNNNLQHISIEWSHYMLDEIDTSTFGTFLKTEFNKLLNTI